jgi:speckle-type POZ protein
MSTSYSSTNHHTLPPTSSSRCLPQSITTTHNFKVKSFSILDGMAIGYWVESSTFNIEGCNWSITFYPDGRPRRNKAIYASIFSCITSEDQKVV